MMDVNDELAAAATAYDDELARAAEQQKRLAWRREKLRALAQATAPAEMPEKDALVVIVFPWRRGLRTGQTARVRWSETPGGVALVAVLVDGDAQIDICPPWCLRPTAAGEGTREHA